MALHPQARRAAEESAAATPCSTPGYDLAAARAANRAEARASEREEVARVEDVDAHGVPARLYTPAAALPGLVVHLHGGGFVFHDVEVHDPLCRRLANRSGLRVLGVDYRCAPEHGFPAAPDDVDAALDWVSTRPELAGPLLLHGDSAGGTLALVAA